MTALFCAPLIIVWWVLVIVCNIEEDQEYKRRLPQRPAPPLYKKQCPPLPNKPAPIKPATVKNVPTPKPAFTDWVNRNKEWLLSQLERKDSDVFLIPNKRIGDCDKEKLIRFLMNDNRTETVWPNEDGVHVRLNRITV